MGWQTAWHNLVKGWFGPFGDNETELVATNPDPPKHRLGVKQSQVESNLGGLSWGIVRDEAGNNHDEYGLFMGRLTADKQSGAFYLALRPAGQADVREILYGDTSVLISRVPIHAPNIQPLGRYYHEGGRFCTIFQADGHIVEYEIRDGQGNLRPESTWTQYVVWTNWHGLVRPLPW